jgi:hypothetical protein
MCLAFVDMVLCVFEHDVRMNAYDATFHIFITIIMSDIIYIHTRIFSSDARYILRGLLTLSHGNTTFLRTSVHCLRSGRHRHIPSHVLNLSMAMAL